VSWTWILDDPAYIDVHIVYSDGRYMSFEDAATMLRDELNYPPDRAVNFVQMFDRNNDGRLSVTEFTQFRNKIEET